MFLKNVRRAVRYLLHLLLMILATAILAQIAEMAILHPTEPQYILLFVVVLFLFVLWALSGRFRRVAGELVVGFTLTQLYAHESHSTWLISTRFPDGWLPAYENMMVILIVLSVIMVFSIAFPEPKSKTAPPP